MSGPAEPGRSDEPRQSGQSGGRGGRGFRPPPYPYDRVAALAQLAAEVPGGLVDCSIGTPIDPPAPAVVAALAASGAERGYPPSAGTPALRSAAAEWLHRRFAVAVDPAGVAACVGTKELVASTAHFLRLRDPSRDTVLAPEVAYPTYAMAATLAGCRWVPVRSADGVGGGLDLGTIDEEDAARALMLWANSPANPSGGLTDLAAAAAWGRDRGVPVFSDECYVELTWRGPPRTVLESGPEGVVSVHSLSKRSNLAGVRAGFFTGDPELVDYLRTVRQHAGLMVPGPVQAAAAVALADDRHVAEQRDRYRERLALVAEAFCAAGCPVAQPDGGFYLWVPVLERFADAWAFAEELARRTGLLVSPGDLYGDAGRGHVRVAMVQPVERLTPVADRLAALGLGG